MVIAATQLLAAAGDKGSDIDVASILGYIVVGIIVGVLARFLVPGRDPMGVIGTIVLGILGAVIGGWVAGAILPETTGVDWIASILAAILLVLLWRAVSGNRNTISS
ncbi:MAG: GlsB/YeaQ/YmgE family stress response membrane protein [Actinomycetota bacterium]|nr:GlsB/YeaQ/YmgE family stress response membrane protein [Actinomycetota bacterium]